MALAKVDRQGGRPDAAAAYNNYMERDAGRIQRAVDERRSRAASGLAGSVNVSFSAGESNLNLAGCLGDDKGNGEKKSFMDIQQQAAASEQILITLKQIASGVENFTSATEHISQTSQNLKSIAEELGDKKNSESRSE